MNVRLATIADCNEFVQLRVEMRNEREKPLVNGKEKEFYDNSVRFFNEEITSGRFIAYVAEDNEKIIAISGLSLYLVPPTYDNINGKVAYLMSMYTIPQYRKKGIGTMLLQKIMEYAKENNYSKITLNASAMGCSLYVRYGFTDLQNEMVYFIHSE